MNTNRATAYSSVGPLAMGAPNGEPSRLRGEQRGFMRDQFHQNLKAGPENQASAGWRKVVLSRVKSGYLGLSRVKKYENRVFSFEFVADGRSSGGCRWSVDETVFNSDGCEFGGCRKPMEGIERSRKFRMVNFDFRMEESNA